MQPRNHGPLLENRPVRTVPEVRAEDAGDGARGVLVGHGGTRDREPAPATFDVGQAAAVALDFGYGRTNGAAVGLATGGPSAVALRSRTAAIQAGRTDSGLAVCHGRNGGSARAVREPAGAAV